ncbi:uncharacterized protein LOC143464679 isoform X2 [Clavelina lepadiformis]|uniref:uncharacterized protein LOC143464679 isoform X2 n=1 Tax=Clavelina lepadiformis TaxID=159417 RepID=UPI004042FB3B
MDISKKKAVVSFDYDAEAKDELTLRVGDVLANLRLVEEGWCEGSLNGKTGVFPDNFVKLIDDTSAAAKPTQSKRKKDILRQMRASFPYERQNDDELDLAVGDIIDVLHDEEKGWATGSLKGREGVFPTNFAELYTGDTSSAMNHDTADDPDRNEEPVKETGSKKVKGVGFGNIFTEGPIKLKPSSFNEPDDSKMDKNQPTKPHAGAKEKIEKPPPPPASQKKPKLVIERCRATFDYEAQTEDELSLVKGDIIVVTNKSCEDAGWWEGEVVDDNGRKRHGMFPDNFVAMLPNVDDETEEKPQHKESKQAKPSIKPVTKTEGEANTKDKVATTPAIKLAHSLKRPAPQIPPAVSKPSAESSVPVINDTGLLSTSDSATDSKLTHYKRASGPKNRRKPDSAGRRERAKEASEEVTSVPDPADAEEEQESESPPSVEPDKEPAPKKEPKRPGIQVMPSPTAGSEGGQPPSWLKNLKNRNSLKKPGSAPLALSPNKDENPTNVNETPPWLSNLRSTKKSSPTGEKSAPFAAAKPALQITSPKPSTQLAANFTPPRPPSPDKPVEDKPWVLKKSMKSKSESDVLASAAAEPVNEVKTEPHVASEPKKVPTRPAVALQPPKPAEPTVRKPMAAVKPKPPPPKAKPALPGAKPIPHPHPDAMKDELKALKDLITNVQDEHRKEINRLTKELEEERKQRFFLQDEVAQLRKQVG